MLFGMFLAPTGALGVKMLSVRACVRPSGILFKQASRQACKQAGKQASRQAGKQASKQEVGAMPFRGLFGYN